MNATRQALRWGGTWMSWRTEDGEERTAAEVLGRYHLTPGAVVTQIAWSRSIGHLEEYLSPERA